ncbi:MAG TPA: hypothetical protein DCR97_09855 [Deltaproteobacteria bacterium]|nr:hypothetical protein [Deltaproteobacteria bacterium]
MGEIKSAIELAMERTKGLVMDDQEKQRAAARELGSRISGLLRRYLEEMIDSDDFQKEYEKVDGVRSQKIELLLDAALTEFDSSDNSEKVFDILSFVGGVVNGRLQREVEDLRSDFHQKIKAEADGVKREVILRLEKMGISGSAVEPNATEWDEWKTAVDQTKSLFKIRLNEWKNKIRQA